MPDTSSRIIWGSPSVVVRAALSAVLPASVSPASCQSVTGISASYMVPALRARASLPQCTAPSTSQRATAAR